MSTDPELLAQVADAIVRGDAIVCYTRCHSCMFRQCPGGWHTWADDRADWEGVVYLLGPDPRLQKCGCPCADGPELEQPDGPDLDSYTADPCPICGAEGECAADSDGRPLIHAIPEVDDE